MGRSPGGVSARRGQIEAVRGVGEVLPVQPITANCAEPAEGAVGERGGALPQAPPGDSMPPRAMAETQRRKPDRNSSWDSQARRQYRGGQQRAIVAWRDRTSAVICSTRSCRRAYAWRLLAEMVCRGPWRSAAGGAYEVRLARRKLIRRRFWIGTLAPVRTRRPGRERVSKTRAKVEESPRPSQQAWRQRQFSGSRLHRSGIRGQSWGVGMAQRSQAFFHPGLQAVSSTRASPGVDKGYLSCQRDALARGNGRAAPA